MKRTISLIVLIQLSLIISSQNAIVSGFVHNKTTGEKLINAIVFNNSGSNSVETNEYGFFSIEFHNKTTISFSHLSYKNKTIQINTIKDTLINIYLSPLENEIDEVIVSSTKSIIPETEISTVNVNIKQIKMLPSLGGETDIIRAVKIFPGIQSGNEGTTGLYVRGGGQDQNLYLLDGVPLYNISHLFGFMSVFNDDAINSMKIIKGGFPARYGGRLSSVIDIRMKEGNLNKLSGNVSLGLISSKFMLEGPLKKKKASFLISARRTYIDAILNSIYLFNKNEEDIDKTNYYFYDITAKVNYKFSPKNRIYLSLYLGNDNYNNKSFYKNNGLTDSYENKLNLGSKFVSIRHNYLFSKKIFINNNLYYSYYHLQNILSQTFKNDSNTLENSFFEMQYSSNIEDVGFVSDLDFYQSENYHIKIGINGITHNFLPGIKVVTIKDFSGSVNKNSDGANIRANELRLYFENNIKLFSNFKFNLGINASIFEVQNTTYKSLEPRASVIYKISRKNSIKTSYSQMQQYLHLLTNSGFGLPTDLWVPPTSEIAPQKAEQYTIGFFQKLPANIILNIEGYYKKMKNMITYKDNTSYFIESKNWDTKVLHGGTGKSYGLEIFCRKDLKKMQLQFAYTLSKTTRKFLELNNGEEYSYKYDRRHDIALTYIYKVNNKINISGNWIFGTGNAVTLPITVYPSTMYPPSTNTQESEDEGNTLPISQINYRNNTEIFDYGERNSQRLPSYHRLDINISFRKQKKRGERLLTFGLYNVYNRKNPYYLIYAYNNDNFGDYNATGEFRIVSLFPVLPSLSYSYKF